MRPRTVFTVLGISLLVGVVLWVIWLSRGVVGWILIAVFLAMALNPAVEFFERRGAQRSRAAVLVSMLALLVIGGLSYLLVPPLVDQIRDFVAAVPDLVLDLTEARGPWASSSASTRSSTGSARSSRIRGSAASSASPGRGSRSHEACSPP